MSDDGREEADNQRDQMSIDAAEEVNPNHLKLYYGRLFPYADMFKWLSYGNDGKHPGCDASFFGRREFSFTLDNDVYLRFQSFNTLPDLENSIKDKSPSKIDIGPVYSVDPSKRHAYAQSGVNVFTPVERELVFDIDITDYDDVRYCCSGADVCLDCWPLMTVAIKVIDAALREDFGFNHILWVFSGRRGVHCWVCDGKARRLTNEQRAAIADYFRVYKGNENSGKKVSLAGPVLHPFLVRSYADFLKDFFETKLLSSQNLFLTEERYEKILEMIPDNSVTSELRGKWQQNTRRSSAPKEDINLVRWAQLKSTLQSGKQKGQGLRRCVEEIVFCFAYPRLDMEVSKHMNHLLKAPFCVHPKTGGYLDVLSVLEMNASAMKEDQFSHITRCYHVILSGRVCVPIDPDNCDEFDPTRVPMLSQLLGELNIEGRTADDGNVWDGTSLGKSIRFFRSSFLQPLLKSCKEEIESSYSSKLQQSKSSISW
ncbi:hypothetical protein Tsubulata_009223 [Turnera subulata]|uniref:DNA primase n=1 Tax=Turnera subulata TaxID=218843 RepID=A0A9Q0IZM9_9ROSI|nr:hypothetical protein Tsubulata_009223 [Turnera subulata]